MSCAARAISHLTMKPLVSPDDHSPIIPPPNSDLNVKEVMKNSESDKDDTNSNPDSNSDK